MRCPPLLIILLLSFSITAFAYTNQAVEVHNEVADHNFRAHGGYVNLDVLVLAEEGRMVRSNTRRIPLQSVVTPHASVVVPSVDYPDRVGKLPDREEKRLSFHGKANEYHGQVVRTPYGKARVKKHGRSAIKSYTVMGGPA